MEIVEEFVEKRDNNNGKPWKPSKIVRRNLQRFRLFPFVLVHFFIFFHFFIFSFFVIFPIFP